MLFRIRFGVANGGTVPKFIMVIMLSVAYIVTISTMSAAQGTPEQRWACQQDAFKYCSSEIPIVSRVTTCMRKNFKNLSPVCRTQFKNQQPVRTESAATSERWRDGL